MSTRKGARGRARPFAAAGFLLALLATFVEPSARAQGAAEGPTAGAQPALPEPPAIDDPDLTAPPPAPRTLANWGDALALVRAQTPTYGSSQAAVERALAQSQLALSGVLPALRGQGLYDHEFRTQTLSFGGSTYTIPPPDTWTASATLTWAVLSPRALYGLGTANRALAASRSAFAEQRRQLAGAVVSTMLNSLAALRVAEINRVGLRSSLERLGLTRTRQKFGQAAAVDVDRAEQDTAVARDALVRGDESLRQAREALALAVGSSVPVSPPGDLDLGDFERAVATTCRMTGGVEARPDVAAARASLEYAERNVTDARLQYLPSIALQSTLSSSTQVTFGPKTTWNAQAVASVPLFDWSRSAAVRDARALAVQARENLVTVRLNALIDLARTERLTSVAARLRDIARIERDLAVRVDERTREGYVHGLGTSLDLVTSGQALRQAELNLAVLTFQASAARANAVLAQAECTY